MAIVRRARAAPDLQRRVAANPLVGGPAGAARPAPGASSRRGCGTRWTRRGGGSVARRRDRADRGRRRRHGARADRRGGCGVDTVTDVVEAAVARARRRTPRGSCSTGRRPGPPLLQIGMPHRRRSSGDPIAAPLPARARRPAGAAAGTVRAVRDAGGRASTRTSSSPRSGGCSARAGRAGCCSSDPGLRATGACPTGTSSTPGSRSSDAQWDALQVPVGMAFFLVNSIAQSSRRLLPEPGGGDRERAVARRRGRTGWGRPRSPASWSRTSRRCSCAAATPGAGRSPEACSSRSTPATGWSGWCALHWRGFDGGAEAWAAIDALLRGAAEAAVAWRASPGAGWRRAEVRAAPGRGPSPTRPGRPLQLDLRDHRRPDVPRAHRRPAHPDPDRAAAPPVHGRGGRTG